MLKEQGSEESGEDGRVASTGQKVQGVLRSDCSRVGMTLP